MVLSLALIISLSSGMLSGIIGDVNFVGDSFSGLVVSCVSALTLLANKGSKIGDSISSSVTVNLRFGM